MVAGTHDRWGEYLKKLKLAISAYADGKGSCPWELAEALFCEDYTQFPAGGGLDKQDAVQLMRFAAIKALYRVCDKYHREGRKGLGAAEWNMYAEILDLEFERDNS